ncbi:thiol-dependent ubiquitin-specific protease [Aureococcus anophagefferens]|nr:thiol-dependent ubiquitin-specific protease [Aureococcus anophagefferens]
MARRRPGDDGLATSSAAIGHGVLQAQALRSFEAQRRGVGADEALARQLRASLDVSAAARQISQSDFRLREPRRDDRGDPPAVDGAARDVRRGPRRPADATPATGWNDFGLREHEVAGDGNCQFRALAHQLAADVERRGEVRARVARQLALERERYEDFCVVDEASVDADFDGFVRRMAKDAEWGDNVTLQAAPTRARAS